MRGLMRNFRHIRGKLIIEVVGAFLIGSGSAASWMVFGRIGLLISAVVVLTYCAFRALLLFVLDPALAFDDNEIVVGRLFRVSRFNWGQLREARVGKWRIDEGFGGLLPSWMPLEREYIELQMS